MKNKAYAFFIFLLSIILSAAFFEFKDYFEKSSSLGLAGLFLVNFASSATFFVPAPAFLAVISGGNLYSPLVVASVASLGAGMGDMIGFLFGHSGRKLTKKKVESSIKVRVAEKYFKQHGAIIIFVFSIIPNPFFDFVGILAGALDYPPIKFFIIMVLGRFIRYLLLAQFGSRL